MRSSWKMDCWVLLAWASLASKSRPVRRMARTADRELTGVGTVRAAKSCEAPTTMKDADLALARSRRPLVIGIGGGGDVVGALATAETARLYHGARPVVGGVSWERRPIDPEPGPRAAAEIEDADELAPGVLLARPRTRVRGRDVLFAESHMAEFLGEPTVLVDVRGGSVVLARGLIQSCARLDA